MGSLQDSIMESKCKECPVCNGTRWETPEIPGKKYGSKQDCINAENKARLAVQNSPVQEAKKHGT